MFVVIPHWEFQEPLGPPDGLGVLDNGVWTRTFSGGATKVTLDTSGGSAGTCSPENAGPWTVWGTSQVFSLASENATQRVYNVSCTAACSTSWHSATAVSQAPFDALHIAFHMQPGFKPVEDTGTFARHCSLIEWASGGEPWCAPAENPSCTTAVTSCIRWASGRTTGNAC
jgi:hypothetical protein